MRMARFEHNGMTSTAVVVGDEIADVGPVDPIDLLCSGPAGMEEAVRTAARRLPLADVRLLAPIPRPPKLLAIGLNYEDHCKEAGMTAPDFPVFFNKQTTCVIGPGDPIHVPRVSALVDYEVRARDRDRPSLPSRSRGTRPRGDRGLHGHQRRDGPRLAAARADHDDRQELRHARSHGSLGRHRRRDRRSRRRCSSAPG